MSYIFWEFFDVDSPSAHVNNDKRHTQRQWQRQRKREPPKKGKCSIPDTRRDQTRSVKALHSLLRRLFIRGQTHLRAAAPDQLWRVTFNVKLAT